MAAKLTEKTKMAARQRRELEAEQARLRTEEFNRTKADKLLRLLAKACTLNFNVTLHTDGNDVVLNMTNPEEFSGFQDHYRFHFDNMTEYDFSALEYEVGEVEKKVNRAKFLAARRRELMETMSHEDLLALGLVSE